MLAVAARSVWEMLTFEEQAIAPGTPAGDVFLIAARRMLRPYADDG
ncbi:MAG: hypothetical protein R2834_21760 [Rhodothermales bacterium]